MHIGINRRHPVAKYLSKLMVNDRWGVPELARAANVSETYISYLKNFATEDHQIWFLMEMMKKHQRSKCTKPFVMVDVPLFVKEQLGPNISAHCQEIYLNWRKYEDSIQPATVAEPEEP